MRMLKIIAVILVFSFIIFSASTVQAFEDLEPTSIKLLFAAVYAGNIYLSGRLTSNFVGLQGYGVLLVLISGGTYRTATSATGENGYWGFLVGDLVTGTYYVSLQFAGDHSFASSQDLTHVTVP